MNASMTQLRLMMIGALTVACTGVAAADGPSVPGFIVAIDADDTKATIAVLTNGEKAPFAVTRQTTYVARCGVASAPETVDAGISASIEVAEIGGVLIADVAATRTSVENDGTITTACGNVEALRTASRGFSQRFCNPDRRSHSRNRCGRCDNAPDVRAGSPSDVQVHPV